MSTTRTTRTRPLARRSLAVLAALAAGSAVGACSSSDTTSSTGATGSSGVSASAPATGARPGTTDGTAAMTEELEISGVWARTSPAVVSAGAAYMEITNGTGEDDYLLGASVDPSIAGKVEIHETTMAEGEMDEGDGDGSMATGSTTSSSMAMGSDTTAMGSGMMQMRPVERIEVAAGETTVLEPGGYHVMLLDLAAPLEAGTTFDLTLEFEYAGEIVVQAEVRATAP